VPITRRTLFQGELLRIAHVAARPPACGSEPVEAQDCNVLVLPLAGLFAKHDRPGHHVLGTPTQAVFIEAGQPYRITYPGRIGDECLTIRFPATALPPAPAGHALLPPSLMLARSLLRRKLAAGAWDPLEVEELALRLLLAVLGSARPDSGHPRRIRQAERVKEAIAAQPEHGWTLGELAHIAGVSPWHLARIFRAHAGESVYRHVLRARLAKALDAVLDGADLASTALDAGFSSHSHFTARFRSVFGMSPAQLRKNVTAPAAARH